jgi:hypothetical protein
MEAVKFLKFPNLVNSYLAPSAPAEFDGDPF